MKTCNKVCPKCGALNRGLLLEETSGWMECQNCHATVNFARSVSVIDVPVYTVDQLIAAARKGVIYTMARG